MTKIEEKKIFKEMEIVLFSYNKYKAKIKEYIKVLKEPALLNKYSLGNIKGSGFTEIKSEVEKIEELKDRIINDISRYKEMVFRIDSALEMIKDNKNYNFIEMRYMQGMTYEEIAEKLDISNATTYRTRNNILRDLKIHFKTQNLI